MSTFRIALANMRFPSTPEESVRLVEQAIGEASLASAGIVCFPECFVPGYRGMGKQVPPPDPAFLERAWSTVAAAAAKSGVAVILGTERIVDGRLVITALVIDREMSDMAVGVNVRLGSWGRAIGPLPEPPVARR